MSRRGYIVLLCFTLPLPVAAQMSEQLPTDTDLHAAACIPLVKHAIDVNRNGLALYEKAIADSLALPPDQRFSLKDLEEGKRTTTQALAEDNSALQRLQAYLLPRLMSLDALAMVAASNRGKADAQELEAFADSCNACSNAEIAKNPQEPDFNACKDTGCKHRPVQDRLASCKNPTWLPF